MHGQYDSSSERKSSRVNEWEALLCANIGHKEHQQLLRFMQMLTNCGLVDGYFLLQTFIGNYPAVIWGGGGKNKYYL
jgi:hypothetical protein